MLSELSQNTSKLSRSVNRGEEKLQYLRKTASERAKEAQQKLAELSQEIVEAEAFKMQVRIGLSILGYQDMTRHVYVCCRSRAGLSVWRESCIAWRTRCRWRLM